MVSLSEPVADAPDRLDSACLIAQLAPKAANDDVHDVAASGVAGAPGRLDEIGPADRPTATVVECPQHTELQRAEFDPSATDVSSEVVGVEEGRRLDAEFARRDCREPAIDGIRTEVEGHGLVGDVVDDRGLV